MLSDEQETTGTWRRPGVGGSALVALSAFIGVLAQAMSTSTVAQGSSYSGWMILFIPAAFGFGFVFAPLLARALEKGSTREWSRSLWVTSGLAPLAFLLMAFLTGMASGSPDWSHLVNAACPLGISVALAFRRNPFESARNLI